MKITFLGTGTSVGVPIIGCDCRVCRSSDPRNKRLRSSLLIEAANLNIIVDTSPDFREQALRHKIRRLDALVFTHSHADHIFGLDDVRRFNTIQDSVSRHTGMRQPSRTSGVSSTTYSSTRSRACSVRV
jgi:phosphoribosyl 1,2-cyclic phosphate phosphodiesterase